MTPQQEHIALQNFKTSMLQSGHNDELDYDHNAGYFVLPWTQSKWLGYKRCWAEQILKEDAPTQGTPMAATDSSTPNPATEEFVFVGGPLHGVHMQDPKEELRLVRYGEKQYLYTKQGQLICNIVCCYYLLTDVR